MAAHRYWRVTGVLVQGDSLELTDTMLLIEGVALSPAPTLSATIAPDFGTLSSLLSGTASEIVSWPASVVRSPGFALHIDCGVSGTDSPELRLGAGSSRRTFPQDLTIQFSDNGLTWETHRSYLNLSYPGDFTLTSFSPSTGEPDFTKVSLLLNGSFTDQSSPAKTVTPVGGATVSSTVSKYGGTSYQFDGTSGYLSTPSNTPAFDFGSGDFTVECWVNQTSRTAGEYDTIFQLETGSTFSKNMYLVMSASYLGVLIANPAKTGWGVAMNLSLALLPALGTWAHVALTRSGNVYKIWLDGVAIGTATYSEPVNTSTTDLNIGWAGTADSYFHGFIDDFRVTKGLARYTSTFTPPAAQFPNALGSGGVDGVLATDPDLPRPLKFAPTLQSVEGADLGPFSAYSLKTISYTAADMANGGTGRIYGTTKEKNTPANTPLSRRVWLVDERSQLVIREAWSDAATGAFEFRDIATGRPYTTISFDHLHNYRAVIADNQLPELQA